jgi:hypothetical protein
LFCKKTEQTTKNKPRQKQKAKHQQKNLENPGFDLFVFFLGFCLFW